MTLRADPNGIAPERALVFEVAGSLPDFYTQVAKIPGLEFLLEDDIESSAADNDFYVTKEKDGEIIRTDKSVERRLYMAMPDLRALQELLRLWELYRSGRNLGHGFATWRDLFGLLRSIRAWGPQDRVLPETLDFWRQHMADHPDRAARFEVELWFHERAERRNEAQGNVLGTLQEIGGQLVSAALIEPIRYHGMLIDLPPDRVEDLIQHPDITLARLDDIMYLRPQSVAAFPEPDEVAEEAPDVAAPEAQVAPDPIAALLDGVPLTNHQRLVGRIVLDDPDDYSAQTPAAKRSHGTSMASLILHGDLDANEAALSRPLFVRPVMVYDAVENTEKVPSDRLALDVIYLAIRQMLQGTRESPASAPTVVILNLSLGDMNRPFSGAISPWARLIDWLSFQHRVLIIVSAGNCRVALPVPSFPTAAAFAAANPAEREAAILAALESEKSKRSLLSPAEALNALTVGAWHADMFVPQRDPLHLVDPFPTGDLPNVSSLLGLGFRRTIKPDLFFDGGRELVQVQIDQHVWLAADGGGAHSGQLSATADPNATGRLKVERRTVGTSNATALVTRSAVRIHDALIEAGYAVPRTHAAVLLKALLVHGAKWGKAGEKLEAVLGPAPPHGWQRHRDNLSRFLGYGKPEIERVLDCAAERATLFAVGDITLDTQHEFDIPLPPSIEGFTELRRLTITLAWLTPVNARHSMYRSATLEVGPQGDAKYSLAVDRAGGQPTHVAITRGTISHCVFEGDDAVAFLDDGFLKLRVACRAQAGALDEPVPYAVAVSLETAVGSGIAVYEEIRTAIQTPVHAAP